METCAVEIKQWMIINKLKFNDDKTEFLIIGNPQQRLKVSLPSLSVGDVPIAPTTECRNLGVIIDNSMTMDKQVSAMCKSISFHLRNISKIRKYLTDSSAASLVHALISSRLDYCNSLLYKIPKFQIKRLQLLQNTAARIVTGTPKYHHITPVLKQLHWLPVESRIKYKILLMVYKSLTGTAPSYL